MKIRDKIDRQLNDTFSENLLLFLNKKFPNVNFESSFNIFSMRRQTTWDSLNKKVCANIKLAVEGYETAYSDARRIIYEEK